LLQADKYASGGGYSLLGPTRDTAVLAINFDNESRLKKRCAVQGKQSIMDRLWLWT